MTVVITGTSLNGTSIVGFGADPIAATLGMLVALRGMTWVIVGGQAIFAFNSGLFLYNYLAFWVADNIRTCYLLSVDAPGGIITKRECQW